MSSILSRANRTRPVLFAVVCAVAFVLTLGMMGAACAGDDSGAQTGARSGAQKIGAFEDVVIAPGETWENVIVVGGDATIQGTVENMVVVVGGDALVASGARIGVGQGPEDTAIVVVFGDVKVEAGATVNGRTRDVGSGVFNWMGVAAISPDYGAWRWSSIAGWIWLAVFLAIAAVIVGAIAPRQVAFVRERVRHHFFSSLGWGALLVVIAVPLITVLLIVTLVGILLLLPWLGVVVPVIYLFGFVSVGAMVGRLILGKREDRRGLLMLAAVLGVVILSILWWIPVAGGIILFLLGIVGFGATCVSVWDWRRQSGRARRTASTGAAPASPMQGARPGYDARAQYRPSDDVTPSSTAGVESELEKPRY